MLSLVFLGLIGYFFYWLFARPKTTDAAKTQAMASARREHVAHDEIVFPRFFFAVLTILILAYNVFSYTVHPGIGVAIFQAIVVVLVFFCMPRSKQNLLSVSVATLGVLSSLAIAWRANGFVQSVNGTVFSASLLLLFILQTVDDIQWGVLWMLRYLFSGFFAYFAHVVGLFQRSKSTGSRLSLATILRTTIITAVVIGFFVGLLSQADPIFAKVVQEIWDQAFGRALGSIVLAVLFSAAVTLRLKFDKDDHPKLSLLSYHDVLVPGVAVSALFGIFLVIQAKYLFGSQLDMPSLGLTYSEYVRKGFLELLSASFFGGVLTYAVALMSRQETIQRRVHALQGLSVVLLVELGFLLGSAWKRDLMYMSVYGLTRVRLIGELFLLWLVGFLLALLLFAVWKRWTEARLFLSVFLLSTAVVVVLNVRNMDQLIVQAAPSHHEFHDYFYLSAISEDGQVGWATTIAAAEQLLNAADNKTEFTPIDKAQLANMKLALMALARKRDKLERKYLSESDVEAILAKSSDTLSDWDKTERMWQSGNLSQYQAFQMIQSDPSLYHQQLDQLQARMIELQKRRNLDLYEQERRLLHELKYPFVSVEMSYYPDTLEDLNRRDKRTASPTPTPSPSPSVSPAPLDLPY